jgi:hypothetical protein
MCIWPLGGATPLLEPAADAHQGRYRGRGTLDSEPGRLRFEAAAPVPPGRPSWSPDPRAATGACPRPRCGQGSAAASSAAMAHRRARTETTESLPSRSAPSFTMSTPRTRRHTLVFRTPFPSTKPSRFITVGSVAGSGLSLINGRVSLTTESAMRPFFLYGQFLRADLALAV